MSILFWLVKCVNPWMPLIQDFSQDFLSSLSGAYFQQTQQKALITEASGNLSMDTESNKINLILCCLKLLELFTFYWKVCKKKISNLVWFHSWDEHSPHLWHEAWHIWSVHMKSSRRNPKCWLMKDIMIWMKRKKW